MVKASLKINVRGCRCWKCNGGVASPGFKNVGAQYLRQRGRASAFLCVLSVVFLDVSSSSSDSSSDLQVSTDESEEEFELLAASCTWMWLKRNALPPALLRFPFFVAREMMRHVENNENIAWILLTVLQPWNNNWDESSGQDVNFKKKRERTSKKKKKL